ncbi:hypothetical protein [Pseudooceanicola algae]|uniref:Lipoprotein n=1 Tax=Pseudooceanicola algae TaxID=1537215 RepID=A0A418SCQ1_9RHOB|nr:hypothetical protein PSAL_033020 [Pseudooceanicola algae]
MTQSRISAKTLLLLAGPLTLGACAIPVAGPADPDTGLSAEMMTQLITMAAPYQDLQSVRLRPEDGCYWYRHAGPVETTMLPLRTVDGRPICTQRVAQAAGG